MAEEVDRYCAVVYHEWLEEREARRSALLLEAAAAQSFSGALGAQAVPAEPLPWES